MAEVSVMVESKILGQAPGASSIDTVLIDLLSERVTVAELIRRAVEVQIHHLTKMRQLGAEYIKSMLEQQYLSLQEVQRQAATGSVRFPSSQSPNEERIDIELEVQKALAAYSKRSYFVMIDGEQVGGLDQELTLTPDSSITFLRLMPLVGG